MMTPEELERDRYEARLKLKRDISAALASAYEEGIKEARGISRELDFDERLEISLRPDYVIGQLVIKIRLYQHLFHRAETPKEQLRALPLDELKRLAQELENELVHPTPPSSEAPT